MILRMRSLCPARVGTTPLAVGRRLSIEDRPTTGLRLLGDNELLQGEKAEKTIREIQPPASAAVGDLCLDGRRSLTTPLLSGERPDVPL